MTKRKLAALEQCFTAEAEGAMRGWGRQFQSKAKVFKELEADGMVAWTEEKVGQGWPQVIIAGWELTTKGHLAYCQSCEVEPLKG